MTYDKSKGRRYKCEWCDRTFGDYWEYQDHLKKEEKDLKKDDRDVPMEVL